MPCNCGGKPSAAIKWVYVSDAGERKEYTNEVEAKAQFIRAGGRGKVERH